jgi:hypothetical protein
MLLLSPSTPLGSSFPLHVINQKILNFSVSKRKKKMEGGRKGKEPAAGVVSPRASSVIGAVASLGTNLVLYPLDLIKVKLQGSEKNIYYLFVLHLYKLK